MTDTFCYKGIKMDIKGFKTKGGTVHKYDYNALANVPKPGETPSQGVDGGYYTPSVTQPETNKLQFAFTPSKADMPAVGPVQVTLPAGQGSGGNVDYTLPVATAETLGGVKPVTKTEAMTQPVGVDANGALYTEPGNGGGSDYVLPVGGAELGGVKNGGNVTINADGTMTAPENEISGEQVSNAVSDWLDAHPEATTTVADGSINPDKTTWMRQVYHNIFNPNDPDLKDGYYFFTDANDNMTGSGTAETFVTGYIPVIGGKKYYINGKVGKAKFYDKAKVFLSTAATDIVPDGAAYMRIAVWKSNATLETLQVYEYIGEDWEYDTYKNLYSIVMTDPGYAKAIADMVEGKFIDGSLVPADLFADESLLYKQMKGWKEFHWNLVNPDELEAANLDTSTGGDGHMSTGTFNYRRTPYLPVVPGEAIQSEDNYSVCIYDSSRMLLQGGYALNIGNPMIMPENAAYIRASNYAYIGNEINIRLYRNRYGKHDFAYTSVYEYAPGFPIFTDEDSKEGFKTYLGIHPWADKNFGIIGDSFTAPGTWCNIMIDNLKAANCWNKAISGGAFTDYDGVPKTAYEQAQEFVADGRSLDVVIIAMGTNDAGNKVTMGDIVESNSVVDFDLTTYTGGMQACLNYLQNNFPEAIIYVGWTPMGGLYSNTKLEYITRMQEVCLMYGVEYIETRTCGVTRFSDVYAECYENGVNGGHPTGVGQQKIGAYMTRLMQSKL